MLEALSGDSRFDLIKNQYINSENKEACDRMCLLLDMCEEEGVRKSEKKIAFNMKKKGYSDAVIAEILEVDINVIQQWVSGSMANA